MDSVRYSAGAPFGGSGTYAAPPLEAMPRIDVTLDGTFAWLTAPSAFGGLAFMDRPER